MAYIIDFLTDAITNNKTIDDILEEYNEQSDKGFIYERLWDIVIKFGYCDIFPNDRFKHLCGNANNAKLNELTSIKKYIIENKVRSGNSGGCSDITLFDIEEQKYIFMTCKFPKDKEQAKDVKYYEIQNIISMIDDNKEIYTNYDIYTLVPNTEKVLKTIKKANKTSKYITKYMTEDNILDKDMLNKYFEHLKKDLSKYSLDKYDEIFGFGKTNLQLRFHQQLIVEKTASLIEDGEKQFLWGCKCRSGKTYMVGGLVVECKENKKCFNAMIITPAPTETTPQFTNDLFHKYKEFDDCSIIELNGNTIKQLEDLTTNKNIFVASKQFLQGYLPETHKSKKEKEKKLTKENVIRERKGRIKNLPLIDMIFFDENHFSGTTLLSKEILETYGTHNTKKIYLTATYNKPLKEWNISEDC